MLATKIHIYLNLLCGRVNVVGQVVESLFTKHKALISSPCMVKKKKMGKF
jgi:hypothetical protein